MKGIKNMTNPNLDVETDDFLPLRDVVFKKLRKAILTGALKPGERLMEIHLGEKLGVSRTPIREAIRKLELEGLVVMIPRRGAIVAEITEKSMKDVLEVRRALDVLSVKLACKRITRDKIDLLEKACEAFQEATQKGDLKEIARQDVFFHDVIVEAAENDRLLQLMHMLSEQMFRYRFEYIKDVEQHANLAKEHWAIYESIVKGDVEKATTLSREHVDNQEASIMKQIRLEKEQSF